MRPARALAALVVLSLASTAHADEPRRLRGDDTRDLLVTGGALAFTLSTEFLKPHLAPLECRFCGTNDLDAGARDLLVLSNGDTARHASDWLAAGLLPAGIAVHQLLAAGDWEEGGRDVLYVLEAASISAALNQLVKFSVGRQRPFVRYGNYGDGGRLPDPDDNLSFYSGHTALAFSLAAAAGTVSSLREYRSTPWVWAIGMTLASGVGYLRIAADKHYLTDVLVGAVVGAGTGVLVPLLLHGREDEGGSTAGASRQRAARFVPLPVGFVILF